MAGAKASALRLYQVCAGSESADRSCAVARCLVLKRPEPSDSAKAAGPPDADAGLQNVSVLMMRPRW